MKQSYPHCNMKYSLSCFCSSQSSQAGSDICSVCCSHPNPTGSEQHPPCTAISHRHQRVRTFRVIHPRAVSIFSSEQTLLISCLSCVCQVGGGGTPLIPQALPLCLPDPQHPFEQSQRHSSWSEDAELWLHPHLGGRGVSGKLKPLLDEPLARGRRGTGLCQQSQPGASPQLSAKISSVTSILWHFLLFLWCTKSNKSPVRSLQTTGAV